LRDEGEGMRDELANQRLVNLPKAGAWEEFVRTNIFNYF
jgi:hypothetical protein